MLLSLISLFFLFQLNQGFSPFIITRPNPASTFRVSQTMEPVAFKRVFLDAELKKAIVLSHVLLLVAPMKSLAASNEDEISVDFLTEYLGVGLVEIEYKKAKRVVVQRVKADSESSKMPEIKAGMIVVAVGGKNVEGLSLTQVVDIIRNQPRPLQVVFRDPGLFFEKLDSTLATQSFVQTQVRPNKGGDYAGEVLKVERIERAKVCTKAATVGDVMEVTYQTKLQDGTVVDGVTSMDSTGPVNTNLFFVLGGQVSTNVPPGWDLSLRGMCVGERRLITLPPSLGYGSEGLKQKGVPPGATLTYDVRLVSLNGVAQLR